MTSATFTITISGTASTSVTVTPVAGLTAPVAAGTVLANISVLPADWQGGVSLSGTTQMAIGGASPNYTVVAAAALAAGSYTATVTVTP